MKTILGIIFILSLTFFSDLFAKDNKNVLEQSMTNKEIDVLFVSFFKEAEMKQLELAKAKEKKLKEELEKKSKENQSKEKTKETAGLSSRGILDHNLNMDAGFGGRVNNTLMMGDSPMFFNKTTSSKSLIKGFLCSNGKCRVVTEKGVLSVGDSLSTGEKIVNISPTSVRTNVRTINF